MQHVFLVGAKSLGAYGGYETFINKLTEYHQDDERIKYHVACKANGQGASVPDGVVVRGDGMSHWTVFCKVCKRDKEVRWKSFPQP